MRSDLRAQMVLHGVVVILLGLLAGFPFMLVLSGDLAGEVRAWRMAHLEGVLNGLVVLAVGAGGGSLALSERQQWWVAVSLIVAAYGNIVASVIGASFGVRGLAPTGPASNFVVFALFTIAVVGVLVGLVLAALGGARALSQARRN